MTLDGITPRRVAAGLALALIVGAGGAWMALLAAGREQHRSQASREAVIMVQELSELVERAGLADEEAVAEVVATFAELHPSAVSIRVVHLGPKRLLAATGPEVGEPAPRRLALEEKPFFDLGQELRAAVETNRQEGRSWKPEIAVAPREGGGLALAAPVEEGAEVVGTVLVDTAPRGVPPRLGGLAFGLAVVVPLLLLAVALGGLRRRPVALAATAAALLVLGLVGFADHARRSLAAQEAGAAEQLRTRLAAEADRFERLLDERGSSTAGELDSSRWDVDVFRQPREAGTEPDPLPGRVARLAAAAAILALLLFALVALGFAARAGSTLVRHRRAYAYAVPALLAMLVLVYFPFTYGVALAFTDANIYNSSEPLPSIWNGIDNFVEILADVDVFQQTDSGRVVDYGSFYWTLGFTTVWTVTNVAIGVSVGLLLALILHRKGLLLKPIYRVIFILPWAVPNYITALIWRGMFHSQFGVINQIVQLFGGDPISWFERPATSYLAVLATNGWLSFPFMMVISLGALQSIPADLYEAARVDGATGFQQFRSITLPSLKPSLVPAIILSVIWTFNQFNIIYLVSGGQPAGSTEILITQAYKIAFEQYRYGYAAAYSVIIFLILLVYGVWQNRVTRASEGI